MDTNTFSTAAEAEAAIVKAIEADYSGINPAYHLDEENFWETVEANAR